jgi:hypothetical protein
MEKSYTAILPSPLFCRHYFVGSIGWEGFWILDGTSGAVRTISMGN